MKIRLYGQPIANLDQRFKYRVWFEGKDSRIIRKSKRLRAKRIANFKTELKRTFALIITLALITGFIWIQFGGGR